jgi:MraZ protein
MAAPFIFIAETSARKGTRARMAQFVGTHQNKLDAKGRVSVPASFRAVLKQMSHAGETAPIAPLVLRRSHKYDCIEGWTERGFAALGEPLRNYDQLSDEHDDLALTLFGDAYETETDKEGRIVLPADLVAHARLTEAVTFIGAREHFQIWEPSAAQRRQTEARAAVLARRLTLPTGRSQA